MEKFINKIVQLLDAKDNRAVVTKEKKMHRQNNLRTFWRIEAIMLVMIALMVGLRFVTEPVYWMNMDISVMAFGLIVITIVLYHWVQQRRKILRITENLKG